MDITPRAERNHADTEDLTQGLLATGAQPPPPYTTPYPPYTAPPPASQTLPSTPPYSQPPYSQPPPALKYYGSTPQQAPATPPSSAQGAIGSAGAQGSGYAQGLPKPPFPLGASSASYQVLILSKLAGRRSHCPSSIQVIERNGTVGKVGT